SHAEQRLVESAHERRTVTVHERLDERAADDVAPGPLGPEAGDELGPLVPALAQQDGGAHAGRPDAVRAAEQRDERLAQLFRAKRLRLEERKLPPVERLRELRIFVGSAQAFEQVAG